MKFGNVVSLIGVVLLASACGGGGGGESYANACNSIGLPSKVLNGTACADTERSPVVRVALLYSHGSQAYPIPVCTGTMISADDVLTATHCFLDIGKDPNIVSAGIINGDVGETRFIPAREINIAPGFGVSGNRLVNDAAILKLEEVPALPVIPILVSRDVITGENAQIYGYGKRQEGANTEEDDLFYNLVAGEMTVRSVTPDHIYVTYDGEGANVCNGDSGGPLMVTINNVPTIVGVTSQGSSDGCVPLDVTSFTNVQSNTMLNWITSIVPDAAAY